MDNNFEGDDKETISDFFAPNKKKIELLQNILRSESGQDVTFEYAEEVGIQLIAFYECLAREKTIVPDFQNEEQ